MHEVEREAVRGATVAGVDGPPAREAAHDQRRRRRDPHSSGTDDADRKSRHPYSHRFPAPTRYGGSAGSVALSSEHTRLHIAYPRHRARVRDLALPEPDRVVGQAEHREDAL